jgi:hypothetical protein
MKMYNLNKMYSIKSSVIKLGETGFVSIIISMLIMIILSIIVIGFAQVSRREERQALDRQLSTGAYYAAESGINDAIKQLQTSPNFALAKDNCTGLPTFSANQNQLDSVGNVAYTCVLVDPQPISLKFSGLSTEHSVIVPLNTNDTPSSMVITWLDENGRVLFPSGTSMSFPPQASWHDGSSNPYMGGLRLTLIPLGSLSRDSLKANTLNAFLYPRADDNNKGNTIDYATTTASQSAQGPITTGECTMINKLPTCSVTISNMPNNGQRYILRLRSFYQASDVTITAFGGIGQLSFSNAQASIDSTGKASDVLRRIQVRVPLINNFLLPENSIETGDSLCKLLLVEQSNTDAQSGSEPSCQITNN